MDRPSLLKHPADFSLPIVGIPYKNRDGSNRQFEVLLCERSEIVELRPEPKNQYDEHAIGVWSCRGVQMGYIPSQRAPYVGSLLRAGRNLYAVFQQLTQSGACIRIGVDGQPTLPKLISGADGKWHDDVVDDDYGFFPDEPPPGD
jgi:hypothetical protein